MTKSINAVIALVVSVLGTLGTLAVVNAHEAPAHVNGVPVVKATLPVEMPVSVTYCTYQAQGQGREAIVVLPKRCHAHADAQGRVETTHPAGGTVTYVSTVKWGGVVWQVER